MSDVCRVSLLRCCSLSAGRWGRSPKPRRCRCRRALGRKPAKGQLEPLTPSPANSALPASHVLPGSKNSGQLETSYPQRTQSIEEYWRVLSELTAVSEHATASVDHALVNSTAVHDGRASFEERLQQTPFACGLSEHGSAALRVSLRVSEIPKRALGVRRRQRLRAVRHCLGRLHTQQQETTANASPNGTSPFDSR